MKLLRIIAFVIALIVLQGCGGSLNSYSTQQSSLRFNVAWPVPNSRVIPSASNSIRIIVKDSNATIVASGLISRPITAWSSPNLSAGTYSVTATALPNTDGSGTVQATGAIAATVVAGQTTNASLTMGSTVNAVTLSAATQTFKVGESVQVLATCKDAQGNVVLVNPSTLSWSSSQSVVASVNTNGLVTGNAVGSSNITATFTEVESALGQGPVTSSALPITLTSNAQKLLYYVVDTQGNSKVYSINADGTGDTLVETINTVRYWGYNPYDGFAYSGGLWNDGSANVFRASIGNFASGSPSFAARNSNSSTFTFSPNKVVFQSYASNADFGIYNKQTSSIQYSPGSPYSEFGQWVADDQTMYFTGQDTPGGPGRNLRKMNLDDLSITYIANMWGDTRVSSGDTQDSYLFFTLNENQFSEQNRVGRSSLTGTNQLTWAGTRTYVTGSSAVANQGLKKLAFVSYDRSFADVILCNYDGTGQQVLKTLDFPAGSQMFVLGWVR